MTSKIDQITKDFSTFGFLCEVFTAIELPNLRGSDKQWANRLYEACILHSDKTLRSFALSDEMEKDLTYKEQLDILKGLKESYPKSAGKVVDQFDLTSFDACNLIIQQYEQFQYQYTKDQCRKVYNLAQKGLKYLPKSDKDAQDIASKIDLNVKVVD